MKIAISQSNYIPWRGYFGIIAKCDVFVFLDEIQYTSRDWRSRNRIKTKDGLKWLSIPVGDSRSRTVREVDLPKNPWKQSHKSTILDAYKNSINFKKGIDLIDKIYADDNTEKLSEFNIFWIKFIATEILGLKCKFLESEAITHGGVGSERILSICKTLSATSYISGPSAIDYLDLNKFKRNKIEVKFADYSRMPEYDQLHGSFVSEVSVLDMIFNVKSGYSNLIEIGSYVQ
jgi:hypothetical protein